METAGGISIYRGDRRERRISMAAASAGERRQASCRGRSGSGARGTPTPPPPSVSTATATTTNWPARALHQARPHALLPRSAKSSTAPHVRVSRFLTASRRQVFSFLFYPPSCTGGRTPATRRRAPCRAALGRKKGGEDVPHWASPSVTSCHRPVNTSFLAKFCDERAASEKVHCTIAWDRCEKKLPTVWMALHSAKRQRSRTSGARVLGCSPSPGRASKAQSCPGKAKPVVKSLITVAISMDSCSHRALDDPCDPRFRSMRNPFGFVVPCTASCEAGPVWIVYQQWSSRWFRGKCSKGACQRSLCTR
jgi:hypothetical protein